MIQKYVRTKYCFIKCSAYIAMLKRDLVLLIIDISNVLMKLNYLSVNNWKQLKVFKIL